MARVPMREALGWWALLWCVAQGQPWLRQAPRWQGLALGMVLAWAMVVLAAASNTHMDRITFVR